MHPGVNGLLQYCQLDSHFLCGCHCVEYLHTWFLFLVALAPECFSHPTIKDHWSMDYEFWLLSTATSGKKVPASNFVGWDHQLGRRTLGTIVEHSEEKLCHQCNDMLNVIVWRKKWRALIVSQEWFRRIGFWTHRSFRNTLPIPFAYIFPFLWVQKNNMW